MQKSAEKIYLKLSELYELYEKVKGAIILAENIHEKRKIPLAPLNQLRSALDHIFKAVRYSDDLEYELKEAKEHIDRAGYDAYEIMASILGNSIREQLEKFSTHTLSTVFPDYFQRIKPQLQKIQVELGEIRTKKKNNTGENEAFSNYFEKIELLLRIRDEVNSMVPSLDDYQKKKDKEEDESDIKKNGNIVKERIWSFLIGLSIGLIILILTIIFNVD